MAAATAGPGAGDGHRADDRRTEGHEQPSAEAVPGAGHGLFGPGSVTWRMMSDPVMWVAGFRALYLQALHPRVMRGTWQNTAFTDRKQAFARFVRTSEFVRVRTYGSTADAERAARRIRKIHATLRGTDPDGSTFRLDEPELLLWVHCGEISSYADVARRSGMPVSEADLDRFVDEQRRSAALVGLDPAQVPASMAGLGAYYARIRPGLYACPEAKQALRQSYHPPMPLSLAPLKLIVPPFNTLAFATLPRWARRMYGAPGNAATDLAATAALRAARRAGAGLPGKLLYEPMLRQIVRAAASVAPGRPGGGPVAAAG
jgi:uncharacterized protein (DUF2236 family)